MIALDTNVLVRLVTRDDEAQARRAKQVLDALADEEGGLFVADVVLAEFCWTLAQAYGLGRADVARAVRALLENATLTLESRAAVNQAVAWFEGGSVDFPDCLIVAKAHEAGCRQIVTFDRRMKSLSGVEVIG